ncbi:MAG TPA: hypothetical protein VGO47_03665, partial [Chlamydiales bacterium]|nr:hypothetical protein [Chlamydiales bacterium]
GLNETEITRPVMPISSIRGEPFCLITSTQIFLEEMPPLPRCLAHNYVVLKRPLPKQFFLKAFKLLHG